MDPAAAPAEGSPLWNLFTSSEAALARSTLITEHLDPASRHALFSTCLQAKNAVLAAAEQATVTIQLHDGDLNAGKVLPSHAILCKANSSLSGLRTRGPLSTKVELDLRLRSKDASRFRDPWPLTLALGAMQQGMAQVRELSVTFTGTLPSSLLLTAGQCCPNLTTLRVGALEAMPSPHHLPHLTSLTIQKSVALESFRPYLLQLTELIVNDSDTNPLTGLTIKFSSQRDASSLFSPPVVSTALRTLSFDITMDDTILHLLLESAPALEVLSVFCIRLEAATHADNQCKWRHLQCNEIYSSSLPCLPFPAGMALDAACVLLDIRHAEEEAAAMAAITRAREHDVTFSLEVVHLDSGDMDVHEEPDAMRMQLHVLASMGEQADGLCLNLFGWTMSAPLMQALHGIAPGSLRSLSLNEVNWLPEPMSYAACMRALPSCCEYVCIDISEQQLSTAQLESLLLGCPVDRTADHPLEVHLWCDEDEEMVLAVEAIKGKMERLGSYPHVDLTINDDLIIED